MTQPEFPHAQTLLDHAAFVRAVARGLVRDESSADDLAQDTWLRAARAAAPRALDDAKNWLATIVRNRSIEVGRSQAQRSARERSAARPEAQASVEVAVAQLDAQRDVVAKVLELEDPYRSVVILRYYHELSHDQIARRLGSKAATVRTQLVRAHEQLRAKLDKQYGDRSAWAGLLLPSAPRGEITSAAKLAALGATAAVVGGVLYLSLASTPSPDAALALAEPATVSPPLVESADAAPMSSAVAQERRETPSAPTAAASDEELLEPAELFDRARFGDYEKATFSFEHGVRDDALGVVRNDWDLGFNHDRFEVRMVVDDESLIVDLGERPIESLASAALPELEPLVSEAALQPDRRGEKLGADTADVRLGHTYFVWTRDSESDLVSAFEVIDFAAGSHLLLDWYSTTDGRRAKGSFHDLSRERSLMATLVALRDAARRPFELQAGPARIVLQLRNGDGGNPVRLDVGRGSSYVKRFVAEPLDLQSMPTRHERGNAHYQGGAIPRGAVFVASAARVRGRTLGDSRSAGEVRAVLAGQTIFRSEGPDDRIDFLWNGRVEIRAGEEHQTHLIVRNASQGELALEGELLRDERELAPQTRQVAVDAKPREHRTSAGPRLIATSTPRLEFVASGGRNTARQLGRESELDLEYEAGQLRVREGRDDAIVLVDLGAFTPKTLIESARSGWTVDALRTAARERFATLQNSNKTRHATASIEAGRAYFALNLMPDEAPVPTLLFATAFEAGVRCELDWFELPSSISAFGSLATDELAAALAQAADHLRREARSGVELREPRAEFQLRAASGNGGSIELSGRVGVYVNEISREPLDLRTAVRPGEFTSAYSRTGLIPAGHRMVVTRVEYEVMPGAQAGYEGLLSVDLYDRPLLRIDMAAQPSVGVWDGEAALECGEEHELVVSATYVTSARVVLHGRFEPLAR